MNLMRQILSTNEICASQLAIADKNCMCQLLHCVGQMKFEPMKIIYWGKCVLNFLT